MIYENINNSIFSIDRIFFESEFLSRVSINDYSIFSVVWNMLLLAIPFFLCLALIRHYKATNFKKIKQKIIAVFIFFLWLIFVPNSAYIVTEVRHLLNYCEFNSAFDVCAKNAWMIFFFFAYSCLGWIFFVALLKQMVDFLSSIYGYFLGKLFVIFVIPIISFGVLVGIFGRFSSWELFTSPVLIFDEIIFYLTNFEYLKNWILFSCFFYVLYYCGQYVFNERINGLFKNRTIK